MVEKIHWLGHASFRIEADGFVIYIDPWQLGDSPEADIILITHEHQDHCSPDDVAKIQKDDTVIVTIETCREKLKGQIEIVKPGDSITVKGVPIEAVPAYNLTKFRSPGNPFHPKESGHVGFIITLGGQRIYHTGDADVIPEMESIETDIALLPVSGTYVMTADEAVQAAEIIQPKVAIPMHIGRGIGSMDAAEEFKAAAPVPVEILSIEA
ncbi:MAG: MBL fold metallo-hydrolase [Anaerolineales bacterium]|nr:MBL fold metallo-hydrolase [Chloroflexota bacterium]MBL6982828.1 MBL fold metallo-hydrolase [Anaerolineales bacterium]